MSITPSTGAVYPEAVRRELVGLAAYHGFVLLADEVYGDLAYAGPTAPIASLDPDAPVIALGSLSKAYLAPGWRAGWMAVGSSPALNDVMAALNAIPGMSCAAPSGAFYAMPKLSLPPGNTDEDYVLAMLREAGVLCVYGSGFGSRPEDGFFRVIFLAEPAELEGIYAATAAFTRDYLRRRGSGARCADLPGSSRNVGSGRAPPWFSGRICVERQPLHPAWL